MGGCRRRCCVGGGGGRPAVTWAAWARASGLAGTSPRLVGGPAGRTSDRGAAGAPQPGRGAAPRVRADPVRLAPRGQRGELGALCSRGCLGPGSVPMASPDFGRALSWVCFFSSVKRSLWAMAFRSPWSIERGSGRWAVRPGEVGERCWMVSLGPGPTSLCPGGLRLTVDLKGGQLRGGELALS